MNSINGLFRNSQPKINIEKTISGARKAYKTQKQEQQSGDVFRKLNNTIHNAAPIIEYAVDAISGRMAKKKESAIHPSLFFETTTFINKLFEESSISSSPIFNKTSKRKSNFYDDIFDKKSWSSEKILIGILILSIIIILITLFLTRLFFKPISRENNKQIQEMDSSRGSIRSTGSSFQE